jgi:hypothetical protein
LYKIKKSFFGQSLFFMGIYKMWMLLCRPITIPVTKVSDQTMISTDKCRIVTVSPTDNESRYVIDIVDDAPEILIKPDKE